MVENGEAGFSPQVFDKSGLVSIREMDPARESQLLLGKAVMAEGLECGWPEWGPQRDPLANRVGNPCPASTSAAGPFHGVTAVAALKQHGFGDQDMWRIALAAGDWSWHEIGPADWRHPAFICRQDGSDLIVHRCRGKLWRMSDIPIGRKGYSGPAYHLPREAEVWDELADVLRRDDDPAQVFDAIYRCGLWGQGSGAGSDPSGEAAEYIHIITSMAMIGGWQTAVDAGCGDGRVARAIAEASGMHIIGIDCVSRILPPSTDRVEYRSGDITRVADLPSADVLIAKDVLHHWPTDWVRQWLTEVIAAGRWRWLICTQDRHQHGARDTHLGGYRGLDPREEPLVAGGWYAVIEYMHKAVCLRRLG